MEGTELPVLQSKEPVYPPADKVEVPQLLVTETVGTATITGEAVVLVAGLAHPTALV